MQPAEALAHDFVEQTVVDRRRFPAHAAEQAQGFQSRISSSGRFTIHLENDREERRMRTTASSKARDQLCALIREAGKGSPTTITKRGRPVAMVISIEDACRLYPDELPQHLKLNTRNRQDG
ncbi:type II toxin-antitoxin system prevent-host-death family antitoxin [Mesorhizobium sp. USDA-HM6]|nr:type II toxin-antitoxin system prevent-host-death family antitoxin [Mesorhizobium sp. USDA-HM6]